MTYRISSGNCKGASSVYASGSIDHFATLPKFRDGIISRIIWLNSAAYWLRILNL